MTAADDARPRPAKRRKTTPPRPTTQSPITTAHQPPTSTVTLPPLPSRTPHPPTYHYPALLTSPAARTALLSWYATASTRRPMPWRQPFQAPTTLSPAALSQRAYQVWISETMLQQTRVATVVAYWTRWMARWPTIEDLAAAEEEEVVGMWNGLGYYSRARRVWMAARLVCDEGGCLPGDVEGLMRLPGVGRYTAGAVASIAFGVAAPVVDGNVLRVLSRQLGVLGDVKGDKEVVRVLWEAAEELVRAVAGDGEVDEAGVSDRPGNWGQALMELGSTVCAPKPRCEVCPITETCQAFAEGLALAERRHGGGAVEDIEDICTLCAPLQEADEDGDGEKLVKGAKKEPVAGAGRLSRFFAAPQTAEPTATRPPGPDARTLDIIVQHARKFPLKKPKKKVREEETLVCAIRRSSDGRYLIHRRPDKGLLAGLWELPSHTLPKTNDSAIETREPTCVSYVAGLVADGSGKRQRGRSSSLEHLEELGSVPWLFSHLKLTMHVHAFELNDVAGLPALTAQQRWASVEDVDAESMGTGMKKCWALVKERVRGGQG